MKELNKCDFTVVYRSRIKFERLVVPCYIRIRIRFCRAFSFVDYGVQNWCRVE